MESSSSTPPTNILPPGENLIKLPSEECEEKFHLSKGSQTELPLLDDHSAKYRDVESHYDKTQHNPNPQTLPPGQLTINLPDQKCEEQFHPTSKVDSPMLDDHSAKYRDVESHYDKSQGALKPQILPKGEKPIRLHSGGCEEKFHPTANVDAPLLDDHSAKYCDVESHYDKSQGSLQPQVLPKGEKPIRLPSGGCEEKFHVTSTTDAPLLHE